LEKLILSDLLKATFLAVSALFPIVNPLGGSPIFLSLTGDYEESARHALSRLIGMNSFFLLVGSYLIGTHILAFFGISLPVVQVGGGLVVIATGYRAETIMRNASKYTATSNRGITGARHFIR